MAKGSRDVPVKQAIWRWCWLLLLLAQLGLFYLSYPRLAGVMAQPHPVGGVFIGVLAFDFLGAGCWCAALEFTEEMGKLQNKQSKGIRRLLIGALVLVVILSLCVIGLNIRAWL